MRRLPLFLLLFVAFAARAQAPSVPPYRVGGDVKAPVVISRVEPAYPEEARVNRISGIVIVEALIDRNGDVRNVQVLKPLPYGLDQAAVDAVKQWKFRPGTLAGEPVDVLFNLTINFKLQEEADFPPPPALTTVILVRHAEKADVAGDDPPLSAAGEARAQSLARILAHVPVTAIYTTPFTRTRATAAPLAAAANVKPEEVPTGAEYPGAIVQHVLSQRGGTIVVVGHSNSTRNVLRALGIHDAKEIAESEYDNLYIVTLGPGSRPKVVSLKY